MACVCEHCHSPVFRGEEAVHQGFSYHKKCLKCYVCSETDLHNAEVFKGVTFCSACARRIFQGCASAKKTKQKVSSKLKRFRSKSKSHRRRELSKPLEKEVDRSTKGVIELAQLAGSTSSSHESVVTKKEFRKQEILTEYALNVTQGPYEAPGNMKKESIDIGTITYITHEILKMMSDIIEYRKPREHQTSSNKRFAEVIPRPLSPVKPRKRKKDISPLRHNKEIYSDLRIAELGASTEIANMALRKKSELPVIIKSDNNKPKESYDSSTGDQGSETSGHAPSLGSGNSVAVLRDIWDTKLRHIWKMPYRLFKSHILTRSSLISVLVSGNDIKNISLIKRLKMLFFEEITQHRGRGLKRLYSTINRRKHPHRMGWLHLVANITTALNVPENSKDMEKYKPKKVCKHYTRSHSYRCMRAQAMKLAGPTQSQLACIRKKITPRVVRKILQHRRTNRLNNETCL